MSKRPSVIGLVALLLVAALGWWLFLRSLTRPAVVLPAPVVAAAPEPEPLPTPAALPPPVTVPVDFVDGVPVRPAGSADVDAEGMLPHPITPAHERIFHENNLIGDLNGAMDDRNVAELRQLLQQYRDEYPEDAHVLQQGYALIADCLERSGQESRAVAQRYYDEELDSGVRRYIRRYCLE